jgi:predicted acetyltransferase
MEIRPVTSEEFPEFVRVVDAAAGLHVTDDGVAAAREGYDLARTLAAFDGSRIVGGTGSDVLHLTLPGSVMAPVARVKETGVLPTHRRRGVLTALMARLLEDALRLGQSLSILYAAEGGIFGRFGYGPAAFAVGVEIDRAHTSLASSVLPSARVRLLGDAEAGDLLPALFDDHRRTQPGQVERPAHFWRTWLEDGERLRRGAGPRFVAVCEDAAGWPAGYVSYRFTGGYPPTTARVLVVEDLVAVTAGARAALWSYCLNIDLVGAIRCTNTPVDEPLRWMLTDPRRLEVTGVMDFLWLRLVDVPAALQARRYPTAGGVVLDVADDVCPDNAGRYLLEAAPDGAECRRTDRPAELALGVTELSAAYLGGVRLATLARAGRVSELSRGALGRADELFAWEPAPWTVTDW